MKKVLIVEDEDAMRGLYRKRLSGVYEIFDTGDPELALALALEHKPAAILLDLKMPKYNGLELCRNFRTHSYTAHVPLFVVTGQSGDHQKECEAIGASGYFEKPIDFDKLKQALETVFKIKPVARLARGELLMRVKLKLQGQEIGGQPFEDRAETESVSEDGFSCLSGRNLVDGGPVQVFLIGRAEARVGIARPVERVAAGTERHRYRFMFEGEKKNWIVQNSNSDRRWPQKV